MYCYVPMNVDEKHECEDLFCFLIFCFVLGSNKGHLKVKPSETDIKSKRHGHSDVIENVKRKSEHVWTVKLSRNDNH